MKFYLIKIIIFILFIPNIIIFSNENNNYLIKTKWGQRDEYAIFAPKNLRLGCWSTAFAQILYYHKLLPSVEKIKFTTSKGYKLEENINDYKFNFKNFINEFTNESSEISKNEVAKYIYFCSLIIEKDFGTGSYLLNHRDRVKAVAKNYNCKAEYISSNDYSIKSIKNIIINEIDKKRPVLIHLRNIYKSKYHAAVIDAYKIENKKFYVHINMGHKGKDDDWFDFNKSILDYNDTDYKRIVTIKLL